MRENARLPRLITATDATVAGLKTAKRAGAKRAGVRHRGSFLSTRGWPGRTLVRVVLQLTLRLVPNLRLCRPRECRVTLADGTTYMYRGFSSSWLAVSLCCGPVSWLFVHRCGRCLSLVYRHSSLVLSMGQSIPSVQM